MATGPVVLEVTVPLNLSQNLPQEGEDYTLYTTLRLRGEVLELYGFNSWDNKIFFEKLISISSLGPRLALNILSVFEPEEFIEAVAKNDVKKLSEVPGIGPRRAEKLCVELRARLELSPQTQSPLWNEALSALLNLGFAEKEARKALKNVFKEGEDLTVLIKEALKRLSNG
ncbi:Holliday junction branch migration protein RuvA [Thermodesulfatator indicus]